MSQLPVGFVTIYDVLDELLLNVITRLSELSGDSLFLLFKLLLILLYINPLGLLIFP